MQFASTGRKPRFAGWLSEWVAQSYARRTALSKVLSTLALAAVVLSVIFLETGRVVGAGLLGGWIGSWFARNLLASFLFGVTALDALTYAGVSLGIVSATGSAALLATRSATSIAPADALARN